MGMTLDEAAETYRRRHGKAPPTTLTLPSRLWARAAEVIAEAKTPMTDAEFALALGIDPPPDGAVL